MAQLEIPARITRVEVFALVKDVEYDEQGWGETSTCGYSDIKVPWMEDPVYIVLEFANIDAPPEVQLIGFDRPDFDFRAGENKELLYRVVPD